MRYLSICSGIEAATVAWHPLGWTAVGYAEIDKFASAVLAERFGSNLPGEELARNGVPNFGDFTAIDLERLPAPVDLLVGGTPCQAFSFAGKRQSLSDARGNLTLAYAVLAHELVRSHGLKNAVWENVPGVLSTEDNAFGCFLGALVGADDAVPLPQGVERWPDAGMVAGPRARTAWRLLDAQYFGLAQRRERVFVVVDFGNGADPAAVLFEPQGMQGNSAPRRETGERPTGTLSARTEGGGGLGTDFDLDGGLIAGTLGCRSADHPSGLKSESDFIVPVAFGGNRTSAPVDVAAALQAHPGPTGRMDFASEDGTGRGIPLLPVYPLDMRQASRGEKFTNNRKEGSSGGAPGIGAGADGDPSPTVAASHVPAIASGWAVRRLTTVECARLQGFPDHHSRIPWRGKPVDECPDGPQYKTYGNSMAVLVMRWLGIRIARSIGSAA